MIDTTISCSVQPVTSIHRSQMPRMYCSRKSRVVVVSSRHEITDDELRWESTATIMRWKRSAIRQVALTDDHAFIHTSPTTGALIPRHPDPDGGRAKAIDALQRGPDLLLPPNSV